MSVEEQLIDKELWDKLSYVMDKHLTPKQKQRLLYHYFGEKSYREIGDLEGKNHKTILESVVAALEKIKKYF